MLRAEASWAPQDQVLGACVSTQPGEGPGGAGSSVLPDGGCYSGEDLWGFSPVGIISAQGLAACRPGAFSSQMLGLSLKAAGKHFISFPCTRFRVSLVACEHASAIFHIS